MRNALLLCAAALSACTVGPNYAGPPEVAPASRARPAFLRAEGAKLGPAPPPARWWDALGDPQLTWAIEEALRASPDVRIARARLRQARATLSERRADQRPNVNANVLTVQGNVGTEGLSELGALVGAGGGATDVSERQAVELYSGAFDASWTIDLFGGQRRAVEGARAQAEAAEAQLEDAQVQLAASVAQGYANLRGLQRRVALSRETIRYEERQLALTIERRRGGTATDLDVERLRAQILSNQAGTPPLIGQADQALDQLSVLIGREPGALDEAFAPARPIPTPPATVTVGNPAAMLRNRPDIRAAERTLAASTASVGQSVAALFPTVSLIGTLGLAGPSVGGIDLDQYSAIGVPLLRWNFLNFGRVRAQIRRAEAAEEEQLATYQRTVLAALQDAENAISRFGRQRENVRQLGEAGRSSARSARLAELRYRGGTGSFIDFLDAERQRAEAERTLAEAEAQLTQDYATLQTSLGLGWTPAAQDPAMNALPRTEPRR